MRVFLVSIVRRVQLWAGTTQAVRAMV